MARSYQQTDTTDNNIRTISPFGSGQVDVSKTMAVGGSAGSVAGTVSVASSNSGNSAFDLSFRTADGDPGTADDWAAGNWTVRFNVTTANMNLTWDGLGIAAVDAGETASTSIVSATSLAISCSTTGVKSTTQSGSAPGSNKDHVQVSCGFSNGAMSTQTLGVTPSELLDGPFSTAATPLAPSLRSFYLGRPHIHNR